MAGVAGPAAVPGGRLWTGDGHGRSPVRRGGAAGGGGAGGDGRVGQRAAADGGPGLRRPGVGLYRADLVAVPAAVLAICERYGRLGHAAPPPRARFPPAGRGAGHSAGTVAAWTGAVASRGGADGGARARAAGPLARPRD